VGIPVILLAEAFLLKFPAAHSCSHFPASDDDQYPRASIVEFCLRWIDEPKS
jgi:hypothetical protein